MKQNKLIIFDFDGTIADSMWAWDELGCVTLQERGLPPLPDYEKVIRTMSVPHFSEYLAKLFPTLAPAEKLMSEWHEKMVYNYCVFRLSEGKRLYHVPGVRHSLQGSYPSRTPF